MRIVHTGAAALAVHSPSRFPMTTWIVFRHAPDPTSGADAEDASIVGSVVAPCQETASRAAHARWMSSARDRLELVPADGVSAAQRRAAFQRAHVDVAAESRRMGEVFLDGRVP